MRRTGFTLIELLIVVAIIAILAAIAVPNFLEAQTRSKVARVKADMRTADTAVNAYIVDNNKAPFCRTPGGTSSNRGGLFQVYVLSSPIAYITTTNMLDPFAPPGEINQYGDLVNNPDPFAAGTTSASINYMNIEAKRKSDAHEPSSVKFVFVSYGPDKVRGPIPNYSGSLGLGSYAGDIPTPEQEQFFDRALYDPTNGSISGGDILRYQGRGTK